MKDIRYICLMTISFLALLSCTTGCLSKALSPSATSAVEYQDHPTAIPTSMSSITPDPTFPILLDATITIAPAQIAATATPTQLWETIDTESANANSIRSLLIDSSGDLWAGGPGGVVRWDVNAKQPLAYSRTNRLSNSNVTSLLEDNGILWVSTYGGGISSLSSSKWDVITTKEGLPSNDVMELLKTRDGKFWLNISRYPHGNSLFSGFLDQNQWNEKKVGGNFFRVVLGNDGLIYSAESWFYSGNFDSTVKVLDPQVEEWKTILQFKSRITAFTSAPDGSLWLSTTRVIYRYEKGEWKKIIPPWADIKDVFLVSSIAVAADGTAWFGFSFTWPDEPYDKCGSDVPGTKEMGVYRLDGSGWTHFSEEDGLVDSNICDIYIAPDGSTWFGSLDKGISRFDGKEWTDYVIP